MGRWKTEPFVINVKAGDTRAFCACGLSEDGPYCDGSHIRTNDEPHVVTFEEDKTIYICGCLDSNNRPYCDGSHKKLNNN